MQNSYKRAFYEMSDGASNIEVNLSKLAVSPARSETIPLLTNLSAQSALAENSLSQLPLDYHEAQNTSKFFNQVGDWSRSYSRDIALGKDLAPYENQAEILYEQAGFGNDRCGGAWFAHHTACFVGIVVFLQEFTSLASVAIAVFFG